MLTIEQLNAFGANTAEGLSRCFGNETFYLRLVAMIPAEGNFDKLQSAVEAGDLTEAFEAAHALKGVVGNLSLTPLYDKICEITELLRAKIATDYAPLLGEVMAMRDALKAMCEG